MTVSSGKVLMIAYYFPPMAAAGSHRVMHFSRELQALAWDVSVVSTNDFRRNRIDPVLLERIPPEIQIRRAFSTDVVELLARIKEGLKGKRNSDPGSRGDNSPAHARTPSKPVASGNGHAGLFDYLSRLMKTPDSMLSFIPSAVFRALPDMMGPRPDVIFSSAPPYSCHLAAFCLKSLFHVPWIADFRDPWAGNPFRANQRYPSLTALNRYLEGIVVQEADQVICNTHALEKTFRTRYPHQNHFVTLTNGFDPQLLERFSKQAASIPSGPEKKLCLVHTGEVYGLRSPHALIDALGEIRRQNAERFSLFRFSFYGKVDEQEALENHARAEGVESAFHFGGQVDHEEALKRCAESEMLLLLGVAG
ncbi:MAG: glycosyltransferase, partial [Planctomycetota bacterium]